jgi:hypothetical protein
MELSIKSEFTKLMISTFIWEKYPTVKNLSVAEMIIANPHKAVYKKVIVVPVILIILCSTSRLNANVLSRDSINFWLRILERSVETQC